MKIDTRPSQQPKPLGCRSDYFMPSSTLVLDAAAMQRALTRIAHEIAERNENSAEVALVGIQRGGVFLARRLAAILLTIWNQAVPVGELDVGMHRDDLDHQATQYAAHRHPL